jgi:hypothetical protein
MLKPGHTCDPIVCLSGVPSLTVLTMNHAATLQVPPLTAVVAGDEMYVIALLLEAIFTRRMAGKHVCCLLQHTALLPTCAGLNR